jgi:hypothetical protein
MPYGEKLTMTVLVNFSRGGKERKQKLMCEPGCANCEFHAKGHCLSVNYMLKINFVRGRQKDNDTPVIPKSQICEYFRAATDPKSLQMPLL